MHILCRVCTHLCTRSCCTPIAAHKRYDNGAVLISDPRQQRRPELGGNVQRQAKNARPEHTTWVHGFCACSCAHITYTIRVCMLNLWFVRAAPLYAQTLAHRKREHIEKACIFNVCVCVILSISHLRSIVRRISLTRRSFLCISYHTKDVCKWVSSLFQAIDVKFALCICIFTFNCIFSLGWVICYNRVIISP